jgi:hypothetical protein
MIALIKFRVEDELKHLMQDEEFRRRIIKAYESQVEGQGMVGDSRLNTRAIESALILMIRLQAGVA